MKTKISLIVAMGENKVIGYNNQLPWSLPSDLAYFKKITLGYPIIMGRKTFESIGKPLPHRENIVITKNKEYRAEGITVVNTIEEAINYCNNKEVFVIGGSHIFNAFYPIADKLFITKIHEKFEGDTFFDCFVEEHWCLVSNYKGIKDKANPYEYNFNVYSRVQGD